MRLSNGKSPPSFIFENTAFHIFAQMDMFSPKTSASKKEKSIGILQDYDFVCSRLGDKAIVVDAARFGSGAHRLRNIWSNLCRGGSDELQTAIDVNVHRNEDDPGAQKFLDVGRHVRIAMQDSSPPFYPANRAGEKLKCLPTLVSKPRSFNYCTGRPGSLLIKDTVGNRMEDEPNANERERLMGYATDATKADGVDENARRDIIGRGMDANMMAGVFGLAMSIESHHRRQYADV
jgi:hypothetical protein